MKKILLFFIAFSISFNLFPSSNYKFVKNLDLPRGEAYTDNIISIGGEINIKGDFKQSLILIGGHLVLEGEIGEDVFCIGSTVEIRENARINGDFFVISGLLDKHPEATVKGGFTHLRFDLKKIESTLLPIFSDSRTVSFLKTLQVIIWFIITLIVFAILPQKVNKAEEIMEENLLKTGVTGIVSLLSFIFLAILFFFLCFVIIGIPLFFGLIIAYIIILIFGRTVVIYYLGLHISRLLKLENIKPSLYILFGIVIFGILKFIPIVGVIILLFINVFEIGIGVAFIFRRKLIFARRED